MGNLPTGFFHHCGLPNLARHQKDEATAAEIDRYVQAELNAAGITPHKLPYGPNGEVPTRYIGIFHNWDFRRAWRYYVAQGPGIPPDVAEEFHKAWGKEVRVDGHCGCPSPLEWFKGFAVGMYHIDTQAGLNAFAGLLQSIYRDPQEAEKKRSRPRCRIRVWRSRNWRRASRNWRRS